MEGFRKILNPNLLCLSTISPAGQASCLAPANEAEPLALRNRFCAAVDKHASHFIPIPLTPLPPLCKCMPALMRKTHKPNVNSSSLSPP